MCRSASVYDSTLLQHISNSGSFTFTNCHIFCIADWPALSLHEGTCLDPAHSATKLVSQVLQLHVACQLLPASYSSMSTSRV